MESNPVPKTEKETSEPHCLLFHPGSTGILRGETFECSVLEGSIRSVQRVTVLVELGKPVAREGP